MNRSVTVALFFIVIAGLVWSASAQNCSDRRACCAAPCAESGEPAGEAPERALVELDGTIGPLVDGFNRDRGKARLVAVLSPTCAGCVHGALGVLESAVKKSRAANLGIHVIWVPMIDGDTETSARQAATLFDGSGVSQYWDPGRVVGTTYTRSLYPTYRNDVTDELRRALPSNHFWRQSPGCKNDVSGKESPLWDVVFAYGPGAEWRSGTPRPVAFSKQIFFYGPRDGEPSGMFFRDFRKPPVEGDWRDEVDLLVDRVLRAERGSRRSSF